VTAFNGGGGVEKVASTACMAVWDEGHNNDIAAEANPSAKSGARKAAGILPRGRAGRSLSWDSQQCELCWIWVDVGRCESE
jgi:hypothetical protein